MFVHKSLDSVINVKVEFGKGDGKVPLVDDVHDRNVSEDEKLGCDRVYGIMGATAQSKFIHSNSRGG